MRALGPPAQWTGVNRKGRDWRAARSTAATGRRAHDLSPASPRCSSPAEARPGPVRSQWGGQAGQRLRASLSAMCRPSAAGQGKTAARSHPVRQPARKPPPAPRSLASGPGREAASVQPLRRVGCRAGARPWRRQSSALAQRLAASASTSLRKLLLTAGTGKLCVPPFRASQPQ